MTPHQFEILIRLHNDEWNSDLISQDFNFIFDRILSPAERDVTLLRIDGLSVQEIADRRNTKVVTIQRIAYNIKCKYRNAINKRLDDWKAIRENKHDNK